MAGKMIQGDPMVGDEFKAYYGESMTKSGKQVAVLCSTPEAVKSEFSSLDIDLASEVSRNLSLHQIDIVKNHKVANWIDDHGGDIDLKELGSEINTDLVVQVRLEHFDFREDSSPDLFRGKAQGMIVVYELVRDTSKSPLFESKPKGKVEIDDEDEGDSKSSKKSKSKKDKEKKTTLPKVREVKEVFVKSFNIVYPPLQPVSITQMKPEIFRKKFLDRVADELSRLFYKHKAGVEI
jgi:hypothetical protein